MSNIATQLTKLNNIKTDLKDNLNYLGKEITEETPLENYVDAVKDIYNKAPKVEGEGSNVVLNNCKKGRMDITPIGNTAQESTTGKNLLEPNFIHKETNGVTCDYINGKWVINGTLSNNFLNFTIFSKTLSAGQYVINGIEGASNDKFQLVMFREGNIFAYITTDDKSFTLTEDSLIEIRLYVYSDYGTFNNLTLAYQLESGTISTEWEPYTGGQASPNPSYKQDIKVVTGNNKVAVRGKNYANLRRENTNFNGVTTEYKGSEFILNGKTTASGFVLSENSNFQQIAILKPGTYTARIKTEGEYSRPDTSVDSSIAIRNSSTSLISKAFGETGIINQVLTFNLTEETVLYVSLFSNSSDIEYNNFHIFIQIEDGEEATSYEPYIEPKELPLDLSSKNKFDGEIENGAISGQNGRLTNDETKIRSKNFQKVKPNTNYIISINGQGTAINYFEYDKNFEFIKYATIGVNNYLTTSDRTKYLKFTKSYLNNPIIQVEEGTEITKYGPYYNYELMQGDYIKDKKIHHKRGQIVFDGSEDENWATNGDKLAYQIIVPNIGGENANNEKANIKCDKLLTDTRTNIYNGRAANSIASSKETSRFYIRIDESITSVALLKAFLQENPIIVEYELEEEETEEIPEDTTLYKQLEALHNSMSHNGTNIIEVESEEDNAQMVVKASALLDTEAKIEELENKVASLESEVTE